MINALHTPQTSAIATTEVTGALEAILTTDKFLASPQMSAFLRYVVEQTLIGNTRRIKAFTVGIEALGKPASFDPQTDPSVRVLAKRLRSSLDTYYQQHPDTPIFIEMKPGSYVPKFLRRSEMTAEPAVTVTPQQSPYQDTQRTTGHSPETASLDNTRNEATGYHSRDTNANATQAHAQPGHHGYQAHLSVQQPASTTNPAPTPPSENVQSESGEDRAARKSSISQLWRAYKSSSKVA